MSQMILRNIEGDRNDWHYEIGHYTPSGEWETLDRYNDSSDASFEHACSLLNRLNGGLDKHALFTASALQGLLTRMEDASYVWGTKNDKERREVAHRAEAIASELEDVLENGWRDFLPKPALQQVPAAAPAGFNPQTATPPWVTAAHVVTPAST